MAHKGKPKIELVAKSDGFTPIIDINQKIVKNLVVEKLLRSKSPSTYQPKPNQGAGGPSHHSPFTRADIEEVISDILKNFTNLDSSLFRGDPAFLKDIEIFLNSSIKKKIEDQRRGMNEINLARRQEKEINILKNKLAEQEKLTIEYEALQLRLLELKTELRSYRQKRVQASKEAIQVKREYDAMLVNFKRRTTERSAARKVVNKLVVDEKKKVEKTAQKNRLNLSPDKRPKSKLGTKKEFEEKLKSVDPTTYLSPLRVDSKVVAKALRHRSFILMNPSNTKKSNLSRKQMELKQTLRDVNVKINSLVNESKKYKNNRNQCKNLLQKNFEILFSKPLVLKKLGIHLSDLLFWKLDVETLAAKKKSENKVQAGDEGLIVEKLMDPLDREIYGISGEANSMDVVNDAELIQLLGDEFSLPEKRFLISSAKLELIWRQNLEANQGGAYGFKVLDRDTRKRLLRGCNHNHMTLELEQPSDSSRSHLRQQQNLSSQRMGRGGASKFGGGRAGMPTIAEVRKRKKFENLRKSCKKSEKIKTIAFLNFLEIFD